MTNSLKILPITNTHLKWHNLPVSVILELKDGCESFGIEMLWKEFDGVDKMLTVHRIKKFRAELEGITLSWEGNPFNIRI